jgi:two-component system, NarL family, nitrate/nitrite response regulator NarL
LDLIRVIVVGRVRIVRESLAAAMAGAAGVDVVAAVCSGDELPAHTDGRPQIAVITDPMPASGVIRHVAQSVPGIDIVAVGVAEEAGEVLACIEAGAGAFVTRDASVPDLVEAIHGLARGEVMCSPRVAARMVRRLASLAAANTTQADAALTPREREVARLIAQGLSNKEIARALNIEIPTVKGHVHNILEKLELRRRSEIVARITAQQRVFAP